MDNQLPAQTENNCTCPPSCCSGNRWFKPAVIVLGILIVLGLFGNIYLLLNKQKLSMVPVSPTPISISVVATPTIDLTANWKTYTNEKYKFEFKYPSNLTIRSDIKRPDLVGFLEGPGGTWPQKFGFWILDNPDNLVLREYLEKYNVPVPDDRLNIIYKNTLINGYEALIINYDSPCHGDKCGDIKLTKVFSINVKGDKFVISFSVDSASPNGNTPEDEKWLEQILSTFRFD